MKKYWVVLGVLLPGFAIAEDLSIDLPSNQSVVYQEIAQPVEQSVGITYTWNNFLMGEPCDKDFHLLEALPFLSQDQQLLKDKMQTYCVSPKKSGVWSDLLTTFRQGKKNLLVNKTLKENGTFLGYIKVIPYFLLDIHNTSPKGNSLDDKLDLIQNAIQNKEPEKVLTEMQKLSPSEQLYLSAIFNEASALVDFQKVLQGGHND